MLGFRAAGKGQQLAIRPPNTPVKVLIDGDRIAQVLSNLVANAMKFTPHGGRITIAADAGDGELRVVVTDTGPGIDPQHLPRLFERFWQGHPDRSGGVGLGLAIAKAIVEAHAGRIWAQSEPGHGSKFVFTMPLAASGRRLETAQARKSLA